MRVVLVGLGNMGRNHLRVLDSTPGVEVVATVDPVGGDYEHTCDIHHLHFDAAIVATPTAMHADFAAEMMEWGKHVLVEKPIASRLSDARVLLDTAEREEVKLVVGHLERLNPAVRRLASALREDLIGTPIHYAFTRAGGYPKTLLEDNNVLLDLAVHDIDVLRMLEGPVRVTGASAKAATGEVIDTAEVLLRARTGATASIHVNWNTPTKIRDLRVTGTKGVAFVDYVAQTCEVVRGESGERIALDVPKREPLRIQLEQAIEYFGGGSRGMLCTAEDGTAAVALAERAMVLADEGYV